MSGGRGGGSLQLPLICQARKGGSGAARVKGEVGWGPDGFWENRAAADLPG